MIIAGVLWGTSGIFVNLLSDYGFSPIQLVATRATVSLVLIGAFLLIKDKGAFITKPFDLLIFLALAVTLFFALGRKRYVLLSVALCLSSVALALTSSAVYAILFLEQF